MKLLFVYLLFAAVNLNAFDHSCFQVMRIDNVDNEPVSGAKVELVGTDKVYYTNSKGECYIPVQVFKQCKAVKIDCISYKTTIVNSFEINSKIILQSR